MQAGHSQRCRTPERPAAAACWIGTQLTAGGRERVTKRVTLGRTSMARKRTSAALLNSPIWAAWRRMRGMSAMVLYHSCSTAAMALASYSSLNTWRKKPSSPPSPSPAAVGGGRGRGGGGQQGKS